MSSSPLHDLSPTATNAKHERILAQAERYCRLHGARLTPIRRQVLTLVLNYPDVVKAYDLLEDLQALRGSAAPPTVYRALDFLVEVGILHRAEALNGFVFCPHFSHDHRSIIMSCADCGKVSEQPATQALEALEAFCRQQRFILDKSPLIINGQCFDCQKKQDDS